MKTLMIAILFLQVCLVSAAQAADAISFNFQNEELTKMIEVYSKASGQKFIMDPGVRGKATILMPEKISVEEAFNQLSSALAVNGFAISKRDDTMVVLSARNIQRSLLEVTTEVPALKPERMVTWIYTPKNIAVAKINRDLRILPSRDGEMNLFVPKNQIIFSDWSSNIIRISELMKNLDTKNSPEVQKFVDETEKKEEAHRLAKSKQDAGAKEKPGKSEN